MPATEVQATAEIERPRAARKQPLRGEALLGYVVELILEGARPMDIARRASIPYAHAARLFDGAYERAWGHVRDRFDPDVLRTMKDELIESSINTVRQCDLMVERSLEADGKGNSRPLGPKNAAIKNLALMCGFNAPTASVNLSMTVAADSQQASQRAYLDADPELRNLALAYKARQRLLGLVVDVGGDGRGGLGDPDQPEGGAVDHGAPPGGDQPPADAGALRRVSQADDLRPTSSREE